VEPIRILWLVEPAMRARWLIPRPIVTGDRAIPRLHARCARHVLRIGNGCFGHARGDSRPDCHRLDVPRDDALEKSARNHDVRSR
jgi:hypothetical protein